MTIFDQLLFSVFNHYKKRFPKKANSIAIFYITFLQTSIVLFLGVFFSLFLSQMNVSTMSSNKAWILFIVVCIGFYFKNWIQYSGKKRIALNAKKTKVRTKSYNILVLWFIPVAIIAVSIILLQA